MRRPTKKRSNQKLTKLLREMLPSVTLADFQAILAITERGHLRHLPPSIIAWQAITTHIRHNHTDYDALLDDGYDSESARHFVLNEINEKLEAWGCPKRVSTEEDAPE